MQFKSTVSRLIAFALFVLSISMIVHAAPAPAPAALAVAESGESGNTLVARDDVSDQCHSALLDLQVKIKADLVLLDNCFNTPNCDCKPIVAVIVGHIKACIAIILALKGVIVLKLDLIVQVLVQIIVALASGCGKWVAKLGLTVYLQIFVAIDLCLVDLINACAALSVLLLVKLKVM
ncbi:hypothetical protein CTheo_7822 [Ceratobasidium theobromae]|uniref:Transmembrane protein n=1 Tax=Ceratobasidium theobromae TaxID=1582974 RepID=A0A5N5QAG8_9AGAM|nr:hypothetical protein CTheo_7822 [Ceratobasidium theobromae]